MKFEITNIDSWITVIPSILKAAGERRIWLLYGDLGSGKTTFVRQLLQYLESNDDISSPTFSLINEYQSPHSSYDQIFHIDLYRLNTLDEVLGLGMEEILDSSALVLIEWPDLAMELYPEDSFELQFLHQKNQRKVLVL